MDLVTFFIAFGILFVGELGDKTQLIVFNLSLEHKKSYGVGIGATLGFCVIVTLGVFFGAIITNFIPISLISIVSGIVFIIIGVLDARHLKGLYLERKQLKLGEQSIENSPTEEKDAENNLSSKFSNLKKNPYLAGFLSIFIMELGDKTQILTITLASTYPGLFEVWLGSFLALSCLAWMGVLFGEIISRKIPKFHLKLVSVFIFIIVGILVLITSI